MGIGSWILTILFGLVSIVLIVKGNWLHKNADSGKEVLKAEKIFACGIAALFIAVLVQIITLFYMEIKSRCSQDNSIIILETETKTMEEDSFDLLGILNFSGEPYYIVNDGILENETLPEGIGWR